VSINIYKDSPLSVKNNDDIARCIILSSLLEISGYPKPGNIHRTKNSQNTRFEHFLAGIAAIQPNFNKFCESIRENSKINKDNLSYVNLGLFFRDAAEKMIEWQYGGNVILGHILILAPLVATAVICLNTNRLYFHDFKSVLKKTIEDTTIQDTKYLYEAIRMSNVGGLGRVDKYDLNDKTSIKQIEKDQITLKRIFEISQDSDLISKEYSTGFNIILHEGLPSFTNIFNQTHDINIAIVNTFLDILSKYPDTLIIRKSGIKSAEIISKKAKNVIDSGGLKTLKGTKLTNELDEFLHNEKGKMNPGTTADIVVGVLFCALIFGLKY